MNVLHLRTGCRLHFGLMELAADEPWRYAGLGMMLDAPGFEISFADARSSANYPTAPRTARAYIPGDYASSDLPGDSLSDSPRDSRSRETSSLSGRTTVDASELELAPELSRSERAELRLEYQRRMTAVVERHPVFDSAATAARATECQIRLIKALPMHSGLGAGTQLACAVAAGLELFARGSQPDPSTEHCSADNGESGQEPTSQAQGWCSAFNAHPLSSAPWLTQAAGRGLRSAIGLFGFLHGGLILDRGQPTGLDQCASGSGGLYTGRRALACQSTAVVCDWRAVLILPPNRQEVCGAQETQWMAELGALPNPHRNEMLGLAHEVFNLASNSRSFNDFTHCLDQYMELAGQLFSRYQGGLYNGSDVAAAVQCARHSGLRAVGQSSWGPTVFGFAENQDLAEQSVAKLSNARPDWGVRIAAPAAHAAEYRWQ